MKPLKLITFDVTNTLIKVNISPAYQYAAMAKNCGIDISESAVQKVYLPVWKAFKRQYPVYGSKQGMNCQIWWYKFVYRVFYAAGYEGSETKLYEVARRLHSEFPEKKEYWDILPGAISVLEELKALNIPLAVLSNFDDRLEDVLKMLELRHYFHTIVTSSQAKVEKPSHKIFDIVMRLERVNHRQALHIGDNIQADYHGALNAGLKAILFDPEKKFVPFEYQVPHRGYRIENLTEILDYVKK